MPFNPNQPRVESGPNAGEWGSGGGNAAGTLRPTDGDIKSKSSGLPVPTNEDDAIEVGKVLRDTVIDTHDTDHNQCVWTTQMVMAAFPEAEMWHGTIPGDFEEGGDHTIPKLGDYFIDVTASQFGLPKVNVFTQDEIDNGPYEEYRSFTRDKSGNKDWREHLANPKADPYARKKTADQQVVAKQVVEKLKSVLK